MTFRDSAKDPVTGIVNSSTEYWFLQSVSSTASSTLVYNNLTVPASPNFPVYPAAATRYIVNLPGTPYYAGVVAGSNPWYVVNVTQDTTMVRVAYDATLTANTYKIFPNTQQRVNAMEIHVGVGSGAASDVISYSGYFENTVISSTDMNNINSSSINLGVINSTSSVIIFGSTIKVGFGGEALPDCDPGGITLNQGTADGNILTFKSSDIAHGITTEEETDTYAAFKKQTAASGGLLIKGISELSVGVEIDAFGTGESISGCLKINAAKANGASLTAISSTGRLITIQNDGSVKIIIYGDGLFYSFGIIDASYSGVRTKRVESANALSIANLDSAFGICTTLGNGFHGIYKVTSSNTYAVWVTGTNSTTWGYNQITVI